MIAVASPYGSALDVWSTVFFKWKWTGNSATSTPPASVVHHKVRGCEAAAAAVGYVCCCPIYHHKRHHNTVIRQVRVGTLRDSYLTCPGQGEHHLLRTNDLMSMFICMLVLMCVHAWAFSVYF